MRCKVRNLDFKKYQVRGRIEVTLTGDGWTVVDNFDSYLVGCKNKTQALDVARFARAYIREHGDIYFGSFPYSIDDPLPTDFEQLDIEEHLW